MKNFILWIGNKYFNKQLAFRVRLFNVLAMAGTVIGTLMVALGIITNAGIANVIVNIVGATLAYGLLTYSSRTGKYQRCYIISIVTIFLGLFPIIFFTTGGYHSGMPSFFIFAVLFTIFMLDGKLAALMSVLETIVYVGICLYAYFHPEHINFLNTESEFLLDIVIAFVAVSIILGVTMFFHFRMYNEQQRELESARKKLSEENAALERLNHLKTEFLGNISHELKTPLTVVSGYAQYSRRNLEGKPDMDEVSDRMRLITAEADRLALMVTQVLDMTRIEEGRMSIAPQRISIVEIIQSTLSTYFPVLNKNNNRLRFRQEGSPAFVYADPARVTQVLVNLIANSVRHTRDGEITVLAAALPRHVEISVTDTGVGISPDILPHIYERFYTKTKIDGGRETGTGLGLFICKHLVEAHGGEITVSSESEKGTIVTFTLPSVD